VIRTVEDPLGVLEDIQGIKNILKLSYLYKVKKLMYSSSSEVYGEPVEIPEREDGHVNAKLPYAVVKLVGENFLRAYYQKLGLKTCAMRFFNVYGPRQDSSSYGFVTGIFIKQALKGDSLTVFGDGTQTRDFVYVEDNVNMSLLALLSDATDGEVINLGNGGPVTIADLAQRVINISDKKELKINFIQLDRGGEIKHRFPDVSKMKRLINYTPQYSLEDGLRKTYQWYKENLNHNYENT
jgi:UDP-glucose 4-epimerase